MWAQKSSQAPSAWARIKLAVTGGAALVGADDGSSGSLWTTVQGFVNKIISALGASVVGYTPAGTGAVATDVQAKLRESVSVKDFGAVGNGVTDDTAAIQAAVNACSNNVGYGTPALYLPSGVYKITAPIVPPGYFIHIYGDGSGQSKILFDGVTAAIKSPAIAYFRPYLHDFSIVGDTTSGIGIDLSPTTDQVYNGSVERMYIESGQQAIYAPRIFSFTFDGVVGKSYSNHIFNVSCGPAVNWRNCYATTAGTGKAGYRLTGSIRMYSCNGVDSSDYWGVFGNDTASADGFQSDFTGDSYPDIELHGCNVEAFNTCGIRVQNSCKNFVVHGGIIDRSVFTTAYDSLVRFRKNPLISGMLHVFRGTSVSSGTGTPTTAKIYTDQAAFILDQGGSLKSAGITTSYSASSVITYPIVIDAVYVSDYYGTISKNVNRLNADRLTVKLQRYAELATVPTGTMSVDVTGYDAVRVQNTTVTTINAFSFDDGETGFTSTARNGRLIVKCEHTAALTLKHNQVTRGGMRLKAGADITPTKGDILEFVHSYYFNGTTEGWIQVGP